MQTSGGMAIISHPGLRSQLYIYHKFQWDGYMLQDAREKLLALGHHVSPTEILHVIKEDPDDDRILECAATAKSDFIVSEDNDLLRLGQFGRCRIVSVRDFINLALTPGTTR